MPPEAAQRKLTTILAADVVGYSRLMAADEEATMASLRTYLAAIDALVDKHNGRVFKRAGDAFLAEFGSAVEAVRCAISIQEDLAVRNRELPDDRRLSFRIGINVGDVLIEGDDLFGDGVNVASRLEGLADTGGICISGSTFDHVKNKLSVAFDDIGAQSVKNIPYPITAFRIVPGQVAIRETAADPPSSRAGASAGRGARGSLLAGAAVGAAMLAIVLAGGYYSGLLPIGSVPSSDPQPVPERPSSAAPAAEPPRAAAPALAPAPAEPADAHPYDGRWRVTIGSLAGCLDNSPRSYVVVAKGGAIDARHHRLPKAGAISPDGAFAVKVMDCQGKPLGTHTATIAGDVGTGRFQGRKPTCIGEITVVRIE